MTTATKTKPPVDPELASAHEGARLLAQRDALDHQIRQRENAELFEKRKLLAERYQELSMRDTDPLQVSAREAFDKVTAAKEALKELESIWRKAEALSLQDTTKRTAFRNEVRDQLAASAPPEIASTIADLNEKITDALGREQRHIAFDEECSTSNFASVAEYTSACRAAICEISPMRLLAIEPAKLQKIIASVVAKIPEPNFEQR